MNIFILLAAACIGPGPFECNAPEVKWFLSSDAAVQAYGKVQRDDIKKLYRIQLHFHNRFTPEVFELGVFSSTKQEIVTAAPISATDKAE